VLLNKLLFDEFTPFRCPLDIEVDSVRPTILSEAMLDAEFFLCNDPVFDMKLKGFARVVFSGECAERAKDPAEVPDRIDIVDIPSSARRIRLDRLSESGLQCDSELLILKSTDFNDGRI
jgi:hypothetical protein